MALLLCFLEFLVFVDTHFKIVKLAFLYFAYVWFFGKFYDYMFL